MGKARRRRPGPEGMHRAGALFHASASKPSRTRTPLLFAIKGATLTLVLCVVSLFWLVPLFLSTRNRGATNDRRHELVPTQSISPDAWSCMDPASCSDPTLYGDVRYAYGPSRGFFPADCQWREVLFEDDRPRTYEYWHDNVQAWTTEQPSACRLQTEHVPKGFVWNKSTDEKVTLGTPATAVEPHGSYMLMKNLWYNGGRWYALVEGSEFVPNIKISRNQQITCIHVKNASEWVANTEHRIVRKDTLLFDYIYFVHPTAIGHWMEMMFPLYSLLKESQFHVPNVNIVLLHLKRWHLMEWVRAVMASTFAVGPHESLPPILLQDETDVVFEQPTMSLEGVPADTWIAFERVMIVRDLFTGGKRSFASTADARKFREHIYQNHGLSLPTSPSSSTYKPPKLITFQRKRANRRIVNEDALLDLLRTYAPVQIVEFNSSHSFQQQAHTSNLANCVFLPPGSAVVELIQRFWTWMALDKSFKDQTDQLADVHHFAWRAHHVNQTVYLNPRDLLRFGDWTSKTCKIEECVEAHTNVDIKVDIDELRTMLDARLPLVLAGAPLSRTKSVWPSGDPLGPQPWTTLPGR